MKDGLAGICVLMQSASAYALTPSLPGVWDATSVNTFSGTNIIGCASAAGAAARGAEDRKRRRYADLAHRYDFAPLAVETSGVLGSAFSDLLQDIGSRVSQRSGEPRETAWLRQRVSLAVVRGNAAAFCGPQMGSGVH